MQLSVGGDPRHHVTNGPTEAMNNLAKRIKRVAFGMTNFVNWRIRVLLYVGRPNWSRLNLIAVTPLISEEPR
jgi:transposase